MIRSAITWAALLLLVPMASAPRAEEFPALYAVAGVASDDVLNIRAEPDAGSPIIGTLPPTATGVEVVGIAGDWAVVNAPEMTGYVALRFLQREEGPAWNALETPLTCLGTEPFWSLKIDPATGTAAMSSPDDPDGAPTKIGQIWPGSPWARAAALSLPEGLVVLTPAACSDGMSDRSYGIAADLFLTAPDRPRLSGCCLLGP